MAQDKTIAIIQSNYIPWHGYFDVIRQADLFITLDTVQYTRRDWRNRNVIKTPQGPQWLTIPVEAKGRYTQAIDETRIAGTDWVEQHIRAIEVNYRKAQSFEQTSPWLFTAMRDAAKSDLLTDVNHALLGAVCTQLGITTPIRRDSHLLPKAELTAMDSTDRLLRLCQATGATHYLSGPAARDYLNVSRFEEAGIGVAWMDYGGYRDHPQCWGEFMPQVSIVDLLLNCGKDARDYLGK